MGRLTDEEKAELTEEELKAVEEGGDEPEEGAGDDEGAAGETDQKPDQEPDHKTDQDAAKPDTPAAEAPQDAKPEDQVVAPSQPAPPPGVLMPTVPADELKRLEDAVAEAKQKFDDGDISYEELSEAQRNLDKAQLKNEFATEYNQKLTQAAWLAAQEQFWLDNAAWKQNGTLSKALTHKVNTMIEANEDREFTDLGFLQEAQRRVIADFEAAGFQVAGTQKTTKTPAELLREAKAKQADRSNIPQDLRNVPAADAPGDQDEFAWLDKLSGEAFERAVSKLTPEQLERYENAH